MSATPLLLYAVFVVIVLYVIIEMLLRERAKLLRMLRESDGDQE
jgi:hypothetical protein